MILDKHGRPHLTGSATAPTHDEDVLPTEAWNDEPTIPGTEYGSPHLNEIYERVHAKPHAIIGPIVTAYPRNVGWHPEAKPKTAGPFRRPLKLSDLSIKYLTRLFTDKAIGTAFPNCAKNWRSRMRPLRITSFKKIFKSFGTRLSDATEERQWRKFVHRATNVHNRNPSAPNHQCRLCSQEEESMMHLLTCRQVKPLWRAAIKFTTEILGAPPPMVHSLAIAFGQWRRHDDPDPLGPEDARAFLRHVFNHLYHDFANVDLKRSTFKWQRTYLSALITFREAARRRGQTFKHLYASRKFTSLPGLPPEDELKAFPNVIRCPPGGTPRVNPAIDAEIDRAREEALRVSRSQ